MLRRDPEYYRHLGRVEGQHLAAFLTRELLANPDYDVVAFEATRVNALIAHLKEMLASGVSEEAVEAFGEACSDAFSASVRERIVTARKLQTPSIGQL